MQAAYPGNDSCSLDIAKTALVEAASLACLG